MGKAIEEARSYRHGEDLPPKRMAWLYRWARQHTPGSHRLLMKKASRRSGGGRDVDR
jgi:hypothetical protein